jgi:hypothetical protein
MKHKRETALTVIDNLKGDGLNNNEIVDVITEALNICVFSVSCCNNCKNFGYESGSLHNPYPEFWCSKNHWDGIESTDDLDEPIDCVDFELKN